MAATAETASPWLHGRWSDLLLGSGVGYLLSIPLLAWAAATGLSEWSLEQVLILSLLFNTPHYGATMVRVLGRPEARQRYAVIMRVTSLTVLACFVAGTQIAFVGSLLVTVYLLWSPWHFAGQNYGLALTFLRRRGIDVDPRARRLLYSAFWLSFGAAFLAFQTAGQSSSFAPDITSTADGISAMRFGFPLSVTLPAIGVLAAAYAAFGIGAIGLLVRAGVPLEGLVPVASLLLSQACWFVIPAIGVVAGQPVVGLGFTALWASVAHSVQYLWVTAYFARREDAAFSWPRWLAQVMLAGAFLIVMPGLVATWLIPGAPAWVGGLGILTAAAVNLHHFIIDGAIWKLRDGRVAKVLLRDLPAGDAASSASDTAKWMGRAVAIVGVICVAVLAIEVWDTSATGSRDLARLEAAATRLEWIGRERVSIKGPLAEAYLSSGRREQGLDLMRATLELRRDPTLLNNLAWMLATAEDASSEERLEAVSLAEEATELDHWNDIDSIDTLAAAYASVGRFEEAAVAAEHAVTMARQVGRSDVDALAMRRDRYRSHQPYRVPATPSS